MSQPYNLSIAKALDQFNSSINGLNTSLVLERHAKGLNQLPEKAKKALWQKILKAILEPIILILIGAALLSLFIGDVLESLAIIGVVFINTIIGLVQDAKAEKAVNALQKMLALQAKVIRNGEVEIIAAKFLVPGDIILLEAGDLAPADARLIEGNCQVDEAHLTGESLHIQKHTEALPGDLKPYQQLNMVFSGSQLIEGSIKAIVTATGINTELGKIAESLHGIEEEQSSLQKKLKVEMNFLVGLAFFAFALVFLEAWLKPEFNINATILLAVSLLVAVFPEGLPASITIALALATERLAKANVIVKKASSIETLGNVDFICSDKTGTLTQHLMSVREIYLDGKFYSLADIMQKLGEDEQAQNIIDIFTTSVLASTAQVVEKDGDIVKEIGDPTEVAMIKASQICGYKAELIKTSHKVLEFLPFSSKLMYSAVALNLRGKTQILIKGAPEVVLKLCFGESAGHIKEIMARSAKGQRLIGFALCQGTVNAPSQGVFLGCAVIYDPPKDEVKQAILDIQKAGVTVAMITGDSAETGKAIAEKVGIDPVYVYSRVTPVEKLRIVNDLQAKGHVVAMTGDGVNDAPALKKADVGIAMGKAGTQVAQEAADVILADDNFTTIVQAVREGRVTYQNLKRLVIYLMTNNIGKVVAILAMPWLGVPMILNPLMILWSNVIMESLPGVGLSIDSSAQVMPAKADSQSMLQNIDRFKIVRDGLIFGIVICSSYFLSLFFSGEEGVARSAAFAVTLLSPQLYAFVIREGNRREAFTRPNILLHGFFVLNLFMTLAIIYTPWLNLVFSTKPIENFFVLWVIGLMSLIVPLFRLAFR